MCIYNGNFLVWISLIIALEVECSPMFGDSLNVIQKKTPRFTKGVKTCKLYSQSVVSGLASVLLTYFECLKSRSKQVQLYAQTATVTVQQRIEFKATKKAKLLCSCKYFVMPEAKIEMQTVTYQCYNVLLLGELRGEIWNDNKSRYYVFLFSLLFSNVTILPWMFLVCTVHSSPPSLLSYSFSQALTAMLQGS